MRRDAIERIVQQLHIDNNCVHAPINPLTIARSQKVDVTWYPLGEVSGVLAIENGHANIGINPKLKGTASKFACAHLLGHYMLHKHISNLFIDVHFRLHKTNSAKSDREFLLEQEAHKFAVALLLPVAMLKDALANTQFDLGQDDALKDIGKKFGVTMSALMYRLFSLKFDLSNKDHVLPVRNPQGIIPPEN